MFAHLPTSKSKPGRPEMVQGLARPWHIECPPPHPRKLLWLARWLRLPSFPAWGGLVRQAADFSSWWKEVRLSRFRMGADGSGPIQTFPPSHPTVQIRSVWFCQTANSEASESPWCSQKRGWMKNVRGRERIPKKWRRHFPLKKTESSVVDIKMAFAAASGLHSEPGGKPEEGHSAQLLQLWEVLESVLESRTFWYEATDHLTNGLLEMELRPDDCWAAATAFYLSWAWLILWNCLFYSIDLWWAFWKNANWPPITTHCK